MINDGYHFMNSPGNDLESIAGQVASGANVIYFTTGMFVLCYLTFFLIGFRIR